jgi:hypothetical protein
MKTLLFVALASLTFTPANAQHRISVHLYNLSGIPPETMDRATREATRIFAEANVSVLWTPGDPDNDEAHTTDQSGPAAFRDAHVRPYLVVRVGRGLAFQVPSAALGISLPHAQFGVSATIFQERVESVCRSAGQDFAIVLGHAIAHEMGHVVLASDAHAPSGIMRARWGKTELDEAAEGQLGFTAQQRAEIGEYASRAAATAGRNADAASATAVKSPK